VTGPHRRLTETEKRMLDAAGFTNDPHGQAETVVSPSDPVPERVDNSAVPGLDRVLEALPSSWHPVSATRFLHTPHPDIAINGAPTTPIEWLKHSGGDVTPVLDLIEIAEWTGR